MTTGEIIKKLRNNKNMSQEDLAKLMGYSHKSSINKIELGKADLPQSKLVAFAKIFDVNPCVLLGVDPETPKTKEDERIWDKGIKVDDVSEEGRLFHEIQVTFGKLAATLLMDFVQLNEQGQQKAIDNISDLTLIDQYKK